jgi:Uma2 family endonuclease
VTVEALPAFPSHLLRIVPEGRQRSRPEGGKYDEVMSGTGLAMEVPDWERIEDPPGQRAELLCGGVRMNPAPRPVHQHVVRLLTNALADAAGPAHLAVFDSEWRVPTEDLGSLYHAPRPDVLVASASALRRQVALIGTPPLVVVEVLSPGNRKADLADKRAVYFTHGAGHYVEVSISEDEQHVAIIWFRRGATGWVEAAQARGDAALVIADPFPLRLRPADLLF